MFITINFQNIRYTILAGRPLNFLLWKKIVLINFTTLTKTNPPQFCLTYLIPLRFQLLL